MRECIGKCCDDASCDLAFMFGEHCYSVECQSEKLCQAVLAKPSHLEPKVSYVARGFIDDDRDKGRCTVHNESRSQFTLGICICFCRVCFAEVSRDLVI